MPLALPVLSSPKHNKPTVHTISKTVPPMPPVRYHRKTVKHYHTPGDLHELTFSCYHRLALLTKEERRRILSRSINAAVEEESMRLVAFVFMPNHVHLLIDPLKSRPNIGRFLARLKQPASKRIKEQLIREKSKLLEQLTVRERPGKTCFRFWQEGPGYDRNLDHPKTILAVIDYIHNNPVRGGLCKKSVDWKWSRAKWYLDDPPKQQDSELPFIHGLRPGTLD